MITYDKKYFHYEVVDHLDMEVIGEYEDKGEWRKYLKFIKDYDTGDIMYEVFVEWFVYVYGIDKDDYYYVFTDDLNEAQRIFDKITNIHKATRMLNKTYL